MVDYYAILHVLPSADADVIKAAFRVLARRYHPDCCTGSKEAAHRRMQEINAAYEVLSDEQKRAAYDRERGQAKSEAEFDGAGDETDVLFEQDWQVACKYCPDAKVCFDYLSRFSTKLAFSYASYLIDTKKFQACREIAHKFQNDFAGNYFGNNISIQSFACQLLLVGDKDAAKAINQAVRVLGKSLSVDQLRQQVFLEHPKTKIKLSFLRAIYAANDTYSAMEFLKLMGLNCAKTFWGDSLKINYNNTEFKIDSEECANWIKENFGGTEDFRCVWQGSEVWYGGFRLFT